MACKETKTSGRSNSIKGTGKGILLLLAGTVLLWWNEGRAVKIAIMLDTQESAVHVENVPATDPFLNGRNIHVTDSAPTSGTAGMEEMCRSGHRGYALLAWLFRIAGLLSVSAGLKCIYGILTSMMAELPILADVAGLGAGAVCSVSGLAWSLLVIALSWWFYRPLTAGILLAVAIAMVVFLVKMGKENKKIEEASV